MVGGQQEAIRVPGDAPGPGPGTTHLHHTDGPSPGRGSQESDQKRPALGKKQHEQPSTDRGREVSASGWGEPRRQLAPRMGRQPCEGTWAPPALLCPGAALTHCQEKHTLSSSLESKEDKSPQPSPLHHHLCLSVLSVCVCVCVSYTTHTHRFGARLKGNFPHLLSRDCFSFSLSSKKKKTSCQVAQPNLLSPPEGSLHSAKPLELPVSPGTGREERYGDKGVSLKQ